MTAQTPGQTEVMHLMTIEMGAWCGATQDGPGIFRASSQWWDVTCPGCIVKRTEWLLALVWDMLQTMPASRQALVFALRAGRLGVRTPDDRPLAMACAGDDGEPDDGRHPDGCPCQFCREDEREERERADREELDDDVDNTIPDTEGSGW